MYIYMHIYLYIYIYTHTHPYIHRYYERLGYTLQGVGQYMIKELSSETMLASNDEPVVPRSKVWMGGYIER